MKTTLPQAEALTIAVRGYVHQPPKPQSTHGRKSPDQPSEWTLVFDTETTIDVSQQLRVGVYQVYQSDDLYAAGLISDPDSLTDSDRTLIKEYADEMGLQVKTAAEFVEDIFFGIGYDLRASIIGFNLPFDLSRLAIDHCAARGRSFRGGFSFQLSANKKRPRVQVKHLSSRAALIQFTAPPKQRSGRGMRRRKFKVGVNRGFFIDVKSIAAALTAKSHSLDSLSDFLKTPHRKEGRDDHGAPITWEYLAYAFNDVLVTWECFVELRRRYEQLGLTQTPLHKIYSEASLGKTYLKQMGIRPWRELQPDFPPELIAAILSSYFGGRAEVRIRRELRQVLYCDFLSMYPTVCTLMGLWRFVIGQRLEWQDATADVQGMLERITMADLQNPAIWPDLTVLVKVQLEADILPVRTRYDDSPSYTIGLNGLTSDTNGMDSSPN